MNELHRLVAAATLVLVVASVLPAGIAAAGHGAEGAQSCEYPYTATDATGAEVTVEEEPQRVVVVGASAAQTMWEIGASEKVVGIDSFSTHLEGAGNVTVVAEGIGQVHYEKALSQNPDLIIVAGNSYSAAVAEEFRKSDVPVFKMPNAASLDDVVEKTRQFGRLVGACEGAAETASWMTERISVVREAVADAPSPSLFVDLGAGQGDFRYSAGPDTFVGGVVDAAGARNIVTAGNFSSPWPQVENEFILEVDPEWILVTYTPGSQYGPSTAAEARAAVNDSEVLSETTAVEEGQVIAVNANHLNQPAPRVVLALQEMAKTLHPEAYATANATPTPTATPTATATATATDTATATQAATATTTATATTSTARESGGGGVPGFGPGVAVVATAAAGAVAARRYQ